jgi:hypothetical protein
MKIIVYKKAGYLYQKASCSFFFMLSIFESLQALDTFVIIENEQSGAFAIGFIEKVFRNKLYFKSFDADGIWDEDGLEILYSQITTVRWNTRYTTVWENHLRKKQCPKKD